ncbi:MAG: DUF2764 domain-containing protein [Bacteroidales bacterium]|nr:DUF2764 domain-containing protein [Bacteroidales bacterium]
MNNYEYIVAGLPDIAPEWKFPDGVTPETILEDILEQLSRKDRALVDLLMSGFDDEKLGADFYAAALSSKNRFIREYFQFDLNLRNAKVRYLNGALGRSADQDVLVLGEEEPEFEDAQKVQAALASTDLLSRERSLDDVLWDKIGEITVFDYFDIDAILGFIAKLHIISRWFKLDEGTGRELFRKLVDEVRGTFKGVQYKAEK